MGAGEYRLGVYQTEECPASDTFQQFPDAYHWKEFNETAPHTAVVINTSFYFTGHRSSDEDALWVDGLKVFSLRASSQASYDSTCGEYGCSSYDSTCGEYDVQALLGENAASSDGFDLTVSYGSFDPSVCVALCKNEVDDWSWNEQSRTGCVVNIQLTMPHSASTITLGYSRGLYDNQEWGSSSVFGFGSAKVDLVNAVGTTVETINDRPGDRGWSNTAAFCGMHGPFDRQGSKHAAEIGDVRIFNAKTFDTSAFHSKAVLPTTFYFAGSRDHEQDALGVDGTEVINIYATKVETYSARYEELS
jgi:hypothetical protein